MPNGGLEICAGPNMANELTGQQIGVYGVPAVPRLTPSSVTAYTAGVTDPSNALQIAEGSGLVSASVPYNGTLTLRMPSYSAPVGAPDHERRSCGRVQPAERERKHRPADLDQEHERHDALLDTLDSGAGDAGEHVLAVVPAEAAIASNFDVQFQAKGSGSCSGSGCPQLDGVQVHHDGSVEHVGGRPTDARAGERLHHRVAEPLVQHRHRRTARC